MQYDKTQTIDAFLTATAAKQPVPGGGSVAGLTGALGAAIGEMVVNYSVGKKDLADYQPALKEAIAELARAREIMLELMLEDQAAFEVFGQSKKLPTSDPSRAGKIDAALLACIRVPQATGATAAAILRLGVTIVDKVNPYLLSDLAVCAELAMATVRCSAYNVRVNLPEVSDAAERAKFEAVATKQVADCGSLIREVIARIWARQGYS